MARLSKNEIALFLTCMSAFGNNDLAMNVTKALKSENSCAMSGSNSQVKKSMPVGAKAIFSMFGILCTLELTHSIIGAATDFKIGEYSIGRGIKLLFRENLRKNILYVVKIFLPIVDLMQSEKYKNLGEDSSEKINELKKMAEESELDMGELLSCIAIDESTKENEKYKDYDLNDDNSKVDILYHALHSSISEEFWNILSNEKEIKKAEEKGYKFEYTVNSMVVNIKDYKFTFTMNEDGSLTLSIFALKTGKIDFKITLMPPKNQKKAV